MGVGTFFHHIGSFLLLAATALLIVVTITSPVIHDLSILKVDLAPGLPGDRITYGTFGYCQLNVNGQDECSKVRVGYQPTDILVQVEKTPFSQGDIDGTRVLTKALILHPIAAGLTFLAFLLCLGAGMLGSFVASLFSGLAFVATVIAMACDFAGFSVIKHAVNTRDNSGSVARWGAAVWCILGAAACSFVATILVFVTCCAGRSKRRSKDAY